MRDGYLRGTVARPATERQMDVLAAFVAAGGSVQEAAPLVGIRPSTVKRHLADLRARSGLTTVQLTAADEAERVLVADLIEPARATTLDQFDEGRRGLEIATAWLRSKASRAVVDPDPAAPEAARL